MENKNTALAKSNAALARVSNQIAITNRLLEVANPFLIPYRKGDKWGFCDRDKRIVIECVYDEVDFFSEGLAAVQLNGKYGFVDKTGNVCISTSFDYAYSFNRSGLAAVRFDKKDILIDKNGLTKFSFYDVSFITIGGYYEIWHDDGLFGLINKFRKMTIPMIYNYIGNISHNLILAQTQQGKFGFFNESGELIIPFIYTKATEFKEGLCSVRTLNNKWGFIDTKNNVVVEFIYEDAKSFKINGYAAVKLGEKWGYINRNGSQVSPFIYEEIQCLTGEFDAVKINNKWGLLDIKNNELVLPCIYEDIKYAGNKYSKWSHEGHGMYFDNAEFELEENFYNVRLEGKWGMTDANGIFKFQLIYDYIHYWSEGFVSLRLNGKSGSSNMISEIVIPLQHKFVGSFGNGIAIIKNEEKFGAANNNGDIILPFIGFSADILDNGIGIISTVNRKGNVRKGYFDNKGTQFWES